MEPIKKETFEIKGRVEIQGKRLRWWWAFGPPLSIVLVTSISKRGKPNVATISMYMPVSERPPLVAIALAPQRYSYQLIRESGEFVINLPGKNLVKAARICGGLSGRNRDKFTVAHLTPISGVQVKPPLIKECFAHLECRLTAEYTAGDHAILIGEPLVGHVDREHMEPEQIQPLIYKAGTYLSPTPL